MSYPIIGIVGGSKSGKDTVAAMINKLLGGQNIAHADPMKRFSKAIFGFSDDQLWGPSEMRNAIHEPGKTFTYWEEVRFRISDKAPDFFQAWGLPHKKYGGFNLSQWPEPKSYPLSSYEADKNLLEHYDVMRRDHHEAWSPRVQLQHFGTEFGRALNPNLWSYQAIQLAESLVAGTTAYSATEGVTGRIEKKSMHTPNWVTISDTRFRNEALNIKAQGGYLIKVVNPEVVGAVDVGLKGHASEAELLSIPRSWMDATIENDKSLGLDSLNQVVKATLRHLELL